jgi:hypothetical protein
MMFMEAGLRLRYPVCLVAASVGNAPTGHRPGEGVRRMSRGSIPRSSILDNTEARR